MRSSLVALHEEIRDATVFVVGGGKSLRDFDYSRLDGKKVIGINQACVYLPNLTAIYWADEDWAAKNDDTLNRHSCKLRFAGRRNPADIMLHSEGKLLGGAAALKITGEFGLDTDFNHVRGNNSGCHVINLCFNAGAANVILLGFDMRPGHWHDDYTLQYDKSVYEHFLVSIDSMAVELSGRMGVINCSMHSAISAFPKIPIEELLDAV